MTVDGVTPLDGKIRPSGFLHASGSQLGYFLTGTQSLNVHPLSFIIPAITMSIGYFVITRPTFSKAPSFANVWVNGLHSSASPK